MKDKTQQQLEDMVEEASDMLGKCSNQLAETLTVLQCLTEQADEDCPQEYRSRHFLDAIHDSHVLLTARGIMK